MCMFTWLLYVIYIYIKVCFWALNNLNTTWKHGWVQYGWQYFFPHYKSAHFFQIILNSSLFYLFLASFLSFYLYIFRIIHFYSIYNALRFISKKTNICIYVNIFTLNRLIIWNKYIFTNRTLIRINNYNILEIAADRDRDFDQNDL